MHQRAVSCKGAVQAVLLIDSKVKEGVLRHPSLHLQLEMFNLNLQPGAGRILAESLGLFHTLPALLQNQQREFLSRYRWRGNIMTHDSQLYAVS